MTHEDGRKIRLSGLIVLLVDDTPSALELARFVLAASGAEVHIATSAREAFPLIDADLPHVVVTDLAMPDIDGFAVMRRARQRHSPPRVVALTGYGSQADRTQVLATGFDGYLIKPVDPAALVEEIRRVANQP